MSLISRALAAGCLLPNSLTEHEYFAVDLSSRTKQELDQWTTVCLHLIHTGQHRLLRTLRLVSFQLNLLAGHILRRVGGIDTIPTHEQDSTLVRDGTIFMGNPRLLPRLPKTAARSPILEYAIGKVIEFIPKTSTGNTVIY